MVCVSRLLEGVEEAVTVHTFYAIDATSPPWGVRETQTTYLLR